MAPDNLGHQLSILIPSTVEFASGREWKRTLNHFLLAIFWNFSADLCHSVNGILTLMNIFRVTDFNLHVCPSSVVDLA